MKIWKWRKEKTSIDLLRSLIAGDGRAEGKPTLFGPLLHSTLAPTSVSLAPARFPPAMQRIYPRDLFVLLMVFGFARLVVAAGGAPSATSTPDKEKISLQNCARYEWLRLNHLSYDNSQEVRQFQRDQIEITLRPGVAIKLLKIRAGNYTEGLSTEQVDALVGVPNRKADSRTWRDMYPEGVRRQVSVPYDYYMTETLVTNAAFRAFVEETGYRTAVSRYRTGWIVDEQANWRQGIANDWNEPLLGLALPDHPVSQVSWYDAMNFAHWLSLKTGLIFRPPTKDEWLLAAYPPSLLGQQVCFTWGNEIGLAPKRANFGTSELARYSWIHEHFSDGYSYTNPVGAFPPNERGLRDMAGNIWSWNFQKQLMQEGRRAGDDAPGSGESRVATVPNLASLGADENGHMTMQGGCYLARIAHLSIFSKMSHPALDGAEDIGIRLVAVRAANSGMPGLVQAPSR